MTVEKHSKQWLRVFFVGCLAICLASPAMARKKAVEPELTVEGEKIRVEYATMLKTLSSQIKTALPAIDADKKGAFLKARAELSGLVKPDEDAAPQAHKAYQEANAAAEAQALTTARAVFGDAKAFLASEALDSKLMKLAILRHGTPAGLAEFAQQGAEHKALIDNLLADNELMMQVLRSGGANGGEYGEAMEVYAAILKASEKARERGTIFQRLALGTALHQPWLNDKDPQSVNGTVFIDNKNPDGQVARYMHYERAYLDDELDPAFKDFNAWECRFITNDPYTNEELTWARQMLRNFRPDHRTNPDHAWRYVGLVKTDVPYTSTRHDPALGLPQQQAIALGGICGRRAFFGRFITRAHGIPARRSTQTGHAAMNLWTPDGWAVRLGAWWSMNWCGPQSGLDFFLDSRAREIEDDYMLVLRAQWVGDALGEDDVNLRQYGKGGGFWDGLAHFKKRIIVADNEKAKAKAQEELAALTAEEARLLGESDKIIGLAEVTEIEIPEDFKAISVEADGTVVVPAVAVTSPKNNTDKVAFLDSWNDGMQLHYHRMGNRPEILRYTVELPKAGKYELTTKVCTVSPKQGVIFRLNRRTMVDVTLPYTKGMWQDSDSKIVEMREGRNSIMITFRAPNRGVSLKELRFKPVQ